MVCSYINRTGSCLSQFIAVICFFGSISTIFAQEIKPASSAGTDQLATTNITYKVFYEKGSGYGYDVFVDGKKLIHQPNIPAVAGMAGFKTKEDSKKVAELVIRKLKNKEMPPTITREELRQLKVID